MVTQGLITILRDGKAVFKNITGSDGYNAPKVVASIQQHDGKLTCAVLYKLATEVGFGSTGSCYVMDAHEIYGEDGVEEEGESPSLEIYRATFDKPGWNPRWDRGTADYNLTLSI